MSLVIIESPYAGQVERNVAYARAAMRDSIMRGEHPIASHLLYTQPGILDDDIPEERERGIAAGLAWRAVADKAVFYVDHGWTAGMLAAEEIYRRENFPFDVRMLADPQTHPVASSPNGLTQHSESADASSGNGEQAK